MYDELTGVEHPPVSDTELREYLDSVDDEDIRRYLNQPDEWGDRSYEMVVSEAQVRGMEV